MYKIKYLIFKAYVFNNMFVTSCVVGPSSKCMNSERRSETRLGVPYLDGCCVKITIITIDG